MSRKVVLCLGVLMFLGQMLCAQDTLTTLTPATKVKKTDSVRVAKHSPTTAMLLSIIPGGGQIYNKKYWKLPIVYGCLAASGYFLYYSADKMISFRNEYINRRDGHTARLNPQYAGYEDENILQLKDNYRRNMEIAIGITAIVYALNIVDAMVDAHLYYFDISDDLSMQWSPALVPSMATNKPSYGISLQFKF